MSTWYKPWTWFGSSSTPEAVAPAVADAASTAAASPSTPAPTTPTYGGRHKGRKHRKTYRGGRKHRSKTGRRKH